MQASVTKNITTSAQNGISKGGWGASSGATTTDEQDDRDQPERGVQVPDARKSSPRLRAGEDAIAHAERYLPQA